MGTEAYAVLFGRLFVRDGAASHAGGNAASIVMCHEANRDGHGGEACGSGGSGSGPGKLYAYVGEWEAGEREYARWRSRAAGDTHAGRAVPDPM